MNSAIFISARPSRNGQPAFFIVEKSKEKSRKSPLEPKSEAPLIFLLKASKTPSSSPLCTTSKVGRGASSSSSSSSRFLGRREKGGGGGGAADKWAAHFPTQEEKKRRRRRRRWWTVTSTIKNVAIGRTERERNRLVPTHVAYSQTTYRKNLPIYFTFLAILFPTWMRHNGKEKEERYPITTGRGERRGYHYHHLLLLLHCYLPTPPPPKKRRKVARGGGIGTKHPPPPPPTSSNVENFLKPLLISVFLSKFRLQLLFKWAEEEEKEEKLDALSKEAPLAPKRKKSAAK